MCIKKKIFSAALNSNKKKPVHIYRPVWVAIYFVKKSELHPGGCLIAGRGCGRRNLVVSQLFTNSRASHCGCGQVQEPGVDRQQDDCRLDTSIIGTNVLIGWLWKMSNHAVLALLELQRFCHPRVLPDPFVKVYLLQDGKKISKKKTSTKRDDTNPIFNEAMIFSVPSNVLQVRTFCTWGLFFSWYQLV